jgi:hypothetical protein
MATKRAIAGARAKLYFGAVEAGWATGVNINENISLQRVDVLGSAYSQEIETIGVAVTMTADFVRILGTSLQAIGIWPQGETADLIEFEGLTAHIFDEIGQTVIYKVTGLKAESRQVRLDRQGVMTTNASWQGVKVTDETGI